jgi:hypothetical protein
LHQKRASAEWSSKGQGEPEINLLKPRSSQGGNMELKDCKFYYGGQDMNFAVYSDDPCRALYRTSIPLPIAQTRVDVYEIEPGANTQWVIVKQRDGDKDNLKLFVKKGDKFMENESQHLSKALKEKILQRFPKLTAEFSAPLAA